jgi:hypothetical protein
MRKLFSLVLALFGSATVLYAAYAYFVAHIAVFGFHAMYPALLGIAVATVGFIIRGE